MALSVLYDETTVGEIVRWYARKCRRLAAEGDFEAAKKIADESQGFDLIVQQFHRANTKLSNE
jgi:hypothetical protein